MTNEYPYVSVIVPVLNREKTIDKCVESLLQLDYPSYEIIVVDNGSTDKTREIVSKYPVKLIIERKRGCYAARNKGLEIAQREIIAFTDSDCVVRNDWLRKLIRNYTSDKVGGVCGDVLSYNPHTVIEQFSGIIGIQRVEKPNLLYQRGPLKRDPNRFSSGVSVAANTSFRKDILREFNGFDTELMSGGDYELTSRVLRAGYEMIYDPEAIVEHKHRSTLLELARQFFKCGKNMPLRLKKHPDGLSFIKITPYVLPPYEFGFKSPIRMLVNINFCNFSILTLIFAAIFPFLLYPSLFLLFCTLARTFYETLKVVTSTRELKWLLIFPFLHFVRHFSFTIAKLYGGFKQRVLAI